jgi:hypothetical protein
VASDLVPTGLNVGKLDIPAGLPLPDHASYD